MDKTDRLHSFCFLCMSDYEVIISSLHPNLLSRSEQISQMENQQECEQCTQSSEMKIEKKE